MIYLHKTVVLNGKVLEILASTPGKSYSDKILTLHDITIDFLDLHFKYKFDELKLLYPDMAELLEINKNFLIEVFNWKSEGDGQEETEERIRRAKLSMKKVNTWLEKTIGID